MRSRYRSTSSFGGYAFGPGPVTPVVKALLGANIALFLLQQVVPAIDLYMGLVPAQVLGGLRVWQLATYMFLHGSIFHILFNMLTLWMFGVELERMWGSRYFAKFYFVSGIGAGLTQLLASLVPIAPFAQMYYAQTIGASGAVYGLLLAYAIYFPRRELLFYGLFPIQVRYFVLIMGGIALVSAMNGAGGVAHMAHLGGIAAGYMYLKGGRVHLISEIKYRYLKWRINRMRRKFDVYSGGRADDINRRVH